MTTLDHDAEGRLTSVVRPDPDGQGGPELQFTYQADTHLMTGFTNTTGETTALEYDAAGTLRKRIRPGGATHQMSAAMITGFVDTSNGLGSENNPAPLVAASDVATQIDPLGNPSSVTVDGFGFPVSRADALGNVTVVDRDHEGRVTRLVQPDPDGQGAPETFFSYDDEGNLLAVAHPDGSTETWTYEPDFHQATSYTDRLGNLTLYEIDPVDGSLLAVQQVVGLIDDPSNGETDDVITSFTYTAAPSGSGDPPAGLLQTLTDPLGRVTAFEYNGRGLVTRITFALGTADEAFIEREYDAADNLIAEIDELGRRTEFTYDNLGRLTSVEGPDPDGNGGPVWTFSHDAAGRLIEEIDPLGRVTQYTYSAGGKVTAITGPDHNNLVLSDGVYEYQYDSEGNRTRRAHIASGEATDYHWDHRNRLVKVIHRDAGGQPTKTVEYDYDLFNRRVAKTVAIGSDPADPEDVSYFIYDGERGERGNAGDHLVLVFDGHGDLTNRYLHGPAVDQILADAQVDSLAAPGEVLWPLTDNLGTVRDLSAYDDTTGITAIANHLTYNAFGEITAQTDPTVNHRFAFTGREWDEDAGLYYYRARWYDPELGRFLSEDPIGFEAGDANLQRYVANVPTGYVDPNGLHGMIVGGGMHAPRPRPPMAPSNPLDRSSSRDRIHEMLGDNEAAKEYVDQLLRLALISDSRRRYWTWDRRELPIDDQHAPGSGGPCAWFVKRFMEELVGWHIQTGTAWPGEFGIDVEQWTNPYSFYGRVHVAIRVQVTVVDEKCETVQFLFYLDAGRHRAWLQGNLGDRSHVFFPEDIPANYTAPHEKAPRGEGFRFMRPLLGP